MNLMKYIPNKVTRPVGRAKLNVQKNSPHILFGAGVVGVVGAAVMACRATLKLEENLDEIREDLESVKGLKESSESKGTDYASEEYVRDLSYVYTKSAIKLGRLYGPSVMLGAVSLGALTGSHIQMTKRNTALTVTLAAVSKAFGEYRERVQAEIGEENELDIYRGVKELEVEYEGQEGSERIKVVDPNGMSVYARCFDATSQNWTKDAEINRLFIQCQQNYWNDVLRARGHVFLNEVYDTLGFERSQAGAVVGWVLDGPSSDNYIDFGMFEASNAQFINGLERSVWLDFNVDGVVFDKI